MKITIDCRMINASGIGTYIKNVLPYVINSFSNEYFFLLGNKNQITKTGILKNPNVEVIDFNCPIYSIKEQILYKSVIPKNISLFWSPHYNFPVLFKGNLLVSVMDLGHLALSQINSEIQKKLYARFMFKQIKNRANSIIYISQFSKNEFHKYIGTPSCNEDVTLLGVDKEWFNIPQKKVLFEKPFILYVGNVKPHKNLGNLIDAFKKIINDIDHKLVIVGKNKGFITEDKTLNAKIKGLDDRIIFTGKVSDNELKQYFKQADIFVFPSLYEGFGLPPLEAMAANLPVVSSNMASLPEVCGDSALYFDPNNPRDISEKIKTMILDRDLRNVYIKKGSNHAKKYNWQFTAQKTINIIEKLLVGS